MVKKLSDFILGKTIQNNIKHFGISFLESIWTALPKVNYVEIKETLKNVWQLGEHSAPLLLTLQTSACELR